MGTENEPQAPIEEESDPRSFYLQKFRLYETRSLGSCRDVMAVDEKLRDGCLGFFASGLQIIGYEFTKICQIDRLDPSELNIREDSATYSESECSDLLKRIHEGNKPTGGLKFVTTCYGIVGFVKFLGPYYMLLITKRRQIGTICGHTVYAVTKSEMITIPNPAVRSNMANSKNENRYKKLLCTVDLTKDFFFSYSYHVMRSLQKNLCDDETGQVLYETMFVWNEFLTRGIRSHLKNTLWTVALVYGFFKQPLGNQIVRTMCTSVYSLFTLDKDYSLGKLSVSGKDFKLTLIARRSRHFAGTRYLKRGVNEKGRVANDVETEQIVFEDVPEGCPAQITSVVQNRGSIPLFWSQETSRLNLKPDIILHQKDVNYEATRLHFENLVKRYGNPIIILNLIKTREKKPRESILRVEFANAIDVINKDLSEENRLKFLHWDLHKHSRRRDDNTDNTPNICNDSTHADISKAEAQHDSYDGSENYIKPPMFQKGVLRTNCIDCLDRTNVAQYGYGLAAIGHQLYALGYIDVPKVDLDAPLADDLMKFYERMGDTLAHQYGGSAAHNKIFSERRGQWRAATQSQEFFRTLQRYYSNAYMDAEKQDAINVFLGHFQPQQGKPALWELGSDQHHDFGRNGHNLAEKYASSIKRSLSDGNILCESNTPDSGTNIHQKKLANSALSERTNQGSANKDPPDCSPEISTCETDVSYSRYTPSMARRLLFADSNRDRLLECVHIYTTENDIGDSNFVDLDWLSSSGNSCEEETYERSALINSSIGTLSSENVAASLNAEITPPCSEHGSTMKGREHSEEELSFNMDQYSDMLSEFSDSFVRWVIHGETLCH
ncbi:hypothetical protein ACLOJK_000964 [Asimina triloba]